MGTEEEGMVAGLRKYFDIEIHHTDKMVKVVVMVIVIVREGG